MVEVISVNSVMNLVYGQFKNTCYYYDYKYEPEVELYNSKNGSLIEKSDHNGLWLAISRRPVS